MTINKSIQKRMRSLEESGYGVCGKLNKENIATELFNIKLEGSHLYFHQDRLNIRQAEKTESYKYDEILEVVSSLNAKVCAEASKNQNTNFKPPLKIKLKNSELVIHIPFLAYSRLLNILSDLKRSEEKQ